MPAAPAGRVRAPRRRQETDDRWARGISEGIECTVRPDSAECAIRPRAKSLRDIAIRMIRYRQSVEVFFE